MAASSYASILGIPLALLALATHAILVFFIMSVLFEMTANSKRILRYALWLSLFIALISLVMGAISSLIIGTYCLFCIATYLLSFLGLSFIWIGQEDKFGFEWVEDIQALFSENKWVLILPLIPAFVLSETAYLDQIGFRKSWRIYQRQSGGMGRRS